MYIAVILPRYFADASIACLSIAVYDLPYQIDIESTFLTEGAKFSELPKVLSAKAPECQKLKMMG